MKKTAIQFFTLVFVSICAVQFVSAQFNIKIPKINKPKVEQPKTENPTAPNDAKQNENRSSSKGDYLTKPEPNNVPKFLLETLEIKAKNESKYWKNPAQDNNPSWFPQVQFDLFYKFSSGMPRFAAEWFNADGSLWFSEPLEKYDTSLRSPYESVDFNKNAVQTTGTFGLKITDTKTSQIVFQGKFKVSKMMLDPKQAPKLMFYVENDWLLPVGYVGFNGNRTDYDVHTRPTAFFWFKGTPDSNQFEAELYHGNQKVATTDKGGNINKIAERGERCYLKRDVCAYGLWNFEWENVVVDNAPSARQNNPNGYFLDDKPGEYTVKVYYKGEPVRETKFIVDANGRIARNAFSEQIFLNDYRVVVPVKVVGDMEKWNPAAWKTDAFYGNPLKGFAAP